MTLTRTTFQTTSPKGVYNYDLTRYNQIQIDTRTRERSTAPVDSKVFKIGFAPGGNHDYAIYVSPSDESDERTLSNGHKLSAAACEALKRSLVDMCALPYEAIDLEFRP